MPHKQKQGTVHQFGAIGVSGARWNGRIQKQGTVHQSRAISVRSA
jgi:hypothetical protein